MSENNKLRLYSYNKVWKVEKKVYSFQNLILPVPVKPYDLMYFFLSAILILVIGNVLPVFKSIPTVIRFIIIPYGITSFLTKKKMDGKNPIKYFFGYLIYLFVEKNSYIEKFKTYPDRKEEKLKLKWVCSQGYSKKSPWDYYKVFNKKKNGKKKKKKGKASATASSTSSNDKKKTEVKKLSAETAIIRISSGPKVKEKNSVPEKIIAEKASKKPFNAVKRFRKIWIGVVRLSTDPKIKEEAIKIVKKVSKKLANFQSNNKNKGKKVPGEIGVKISNSKAIEENKSGKINKEKRSKIKEKRRVPILDDITMIISVSSLSSGVGCTHLAKSLAYFIKHDLKSSVCLVDIKGKILTNEINGIEIFKKENLYDLYDRYKYIILDIGKYDAAQKEIKQSQIKIMCALLEDSYLNKLAQFVRDEEGSKKWKYVFNHVPSNKQKKVNDLMELYEHWCMPVNDAKNFDDDMEDVFYRLLKGEKL